MFIVMKNHVIQHNSASHSMDVFLNENLIAF